MTVRKITKTTLSLIILIAGFVFFRLYYVNLLSRFMLYIHSDEEHVPVIADRLFPNKFIGGYFPALFFFCVIIIITARLIDAIFDQKTAFGILSPFVHPLILALIITAALCIEKINLLQLWAIIYFCLLICLHSTFKKIILHSESAGSYADLKLIKGFFLTIKNTVLRIISTGVNNFSNPVDEITVLSASALVLLLEVIAIISYIIYMAAYWRLIFLSQLINNL